RPVRHVVDLVEGGEQAADQDVVPATALEEVGPRTAGQQIPPAAAVELIHTRGADQHVVAAASVERVIAGAAVEVRGPDGFVLYGVASAPTEYPQMADVREVDPALGDVLAVDRHLEGRPGRGFHGRGRNVVIVVRAADADDAAGLGGGQEGHRR